MDQRSRTSPHMKHHQWSPFSLNHPDSSSSSWSYISHSKCRYLSPQNQLLEQQCFRAPLRRYKIYFFGGWYSSVFSSWSFSLFLLNRVRVNNSTDTVMMVKIFWTSESIFPTRSVYGIALIQWKTRYFVWLLIDRPIGLTLTCRGPTRDEQLNSTDGVLLSLYFRFSDFQSSFVQHADRRSLRILWIFSRRIEIEFYVNVISFIVQIVLQQCFSFVH